MNARTLAVSERSLMAFAGLSATAGVVIGVWIADGSLFLTIGIWMLCMLLVGLHAFDRRTNLRTSGGFE